MDGSCRRSFATRSRATLRDASSRAVTGRCKILTPASRSSHPVRFTDFDAEPWPDANPDDLANWDDTRDYAARDGRVGNGSASLRLSDDACSVAVRIQLRRARRQPPTVGEGAASDEADDDGVY